MRSMSKLWFLFAVLAVLFLFGGAGTAVQATEESAAYMQAIQLQLHIDKAVVVGTEVIADIQANGSNTSTANLSATLNALVELRADINPNSTTIKQVQQQRKDAMELVKSFRTQAHALIPAEKRAEIKAEAEVKAEEKLAAHEKRVKEMRKQFNERKLEAYVEAQQRLALGLNASENVSAVPELAKRLLPIKAKIMADQVSRDQLAQIRTQIKADVELLKANKTQAIAEIRAHQLARQVEVVEIAINKSIEANLSVTELQENRAAMVALLDAYAAGSITADEFDVKARTLIVDSVKLMQGPNFARIRGEIMSDARSNRLEIKSEIKNSLGEWKEERKIVDGEIRQRMEMRQRLPGLEIRKEIREENGEIRIREETRVDNSGRGRGPRSGSDDSDDDSDDDSHDDEDESDDESDDDWNSGSSVRVNVQ